MVPVSPLTMCVLLLAGVTEKKTLHAYMDNGLNGFGNMDTWTATCTCESDPATGAKSYKCDSCILCIKSHCKQQPLHTSHREIEHNTVLYRVDRRSLSFSS